MARIKITTLSSGRRIAAAGGYWITIELAQQAWIASFNTNHDGMRYLGEVHWPTAELAEAHVRAFADDRPEPTQADAAKHHIAATADTVNRTRSTT